MLSLSSAAAFGPTVDNSGTGTTDLTAAITTPNGAAGALLTFNVSALTNNTATSFGYGFVLLDGAGNVLFDLTAPAAADKCGVTFTAFTAPFGGGVVIGGGAAAGRFGGTAVAQGITVFPGTLTPQIKVQRFVLGGALTSLAATWSLFWLWDKSANAFIAPQG